MTKVDALRAMREARYAENQKRAAGGGTKPAAPRAPKKPAAAPEPETAPEGLCGHKSMNGRSCTREAGHPQKSHRYS